MILNVEPSRNLREPSFEALLLTLTHPVGELLQLGLGGVVPHHPHGPAQLPGADEVVLVVVALPEGHCLYTLSIHYLYIIYTLSIHYLYTIYTVSTP